jgi:hypothetical protein
VTLKAVSMDNSLGQLDIRPSIYLGQVKTTLHVASKVAIYVLGGFEFQKAAIESHFLRASEMSHTSIGRFGPQGKLLIGFAE